MALRPRLLGWFHRTGSEVLGWTLVVLGLFMLVLPGPGLLGLVAGVALLARHYHWARRSLEPLHARAIEAARYGVATWPRIILSALGAACVFAVGVVWWSDILIPEFSVFGLEFGPRLPAGGPVTAIGMFLSAAIAWFLLGYSVWKYRYAVARIASRSRSAEDVTD
ncbi:PGPGW domain-containing protein [Aeromicrobium sp. YIM 150415]|uniref:Transmembrane protein PGPGW n=1 Tax=Aeromicrobium piscarium TaxID=2590901 RepID=A0A554SPU9_9ACTN|nr:MULTISPECIES: PGPGW domain-containing protein [Aeromicrobium]MBM9462184.1 PGPGW domain-containing protein [Aeromicrobium sp. YIM 150415]TSD68364.1 hypothetical protein FNM00_01860 [Aeromicrobium piscarium]